MKKISYLFLFLASTSAFAGAANTQIQCQSRDGLKIVGLVPGDEADFQLEISQEGRQLNLFSRYNFDTNVQEENASISVVEQPKDSVYTLVLNQKGNDKYGTMQLYALPKTVSYKRIPNGYRASFTAKVLYNFSELNGETQNKEVSCTLKYEI